MQKKDRIRQQNSTGMHRAMFIKGTDERAIATKYNGTMVFARGKNGEHLKDDEIELRSTGVVSHSRAN